MTVSFTQQDVASPIESEVRSYSRGWPATFTSAKGAKLWAEDREYLDFFAAAGSLNYGHNDPDAQRALIDYIRSDGILQSLDMQTSARMRFIDTFSELVLEPRDLGGYRMMFTGPTGTNAIEAALKCARVATGRTQAISFSRGFHGVSLGSLSVTSNESKRSAAGVALTDASQFPFDSPNIPPEEAVEWFERIHFSDRKTSNLPACVVMELIQGEGGINVARVAWAQGVEAVCRKYDVPLIVDEIQMGCGRTGPFFAFENYGIKPDIVTVSKSLSGLGLPLAIVLVRPDLDLTEPGQHNGTFRGNNAAFTTATASLRKFWSDDLLERQTAEKSEIVRDILTVSGVSEIFDVRGKGLVLGIDVLDGSKAARVASQLFDDGVLVETAGARDEVVKLLPPLTISENELFTGVQLIAKALMRQQ